MKKKILVLMLATSMAASVLAGCGSKEAPVEDEVSVAEEEADAVVEMQVGDDTEEIGYDDDETFFVPSGLSLKEGLQELLDYYTEGKAEYGWYEVSDEDVALFLDGFDMRSEASFDEFMSVYTEQMQSEYPGTSEADIRQALALTLVMMQDAEIGEDGTMSYSYDSEEDGLDITVEPAEGVDVEVTD